MYVSLCFPFLSGIYSLFVPPSLLEAWRLASASAHPTKGSEEQHKTRLGNATMEDDDQFAPCRR